MMDHHNGPVKARIDKKRTLRLPSRRAETGGIMGFKTIRVAAGAACLAGLALGAWGCESEHITATLGELEAVPDPVEFGEVPVSTLKSLDVTLTNRGTATVHLHGLQITENDADFSLSRTSPTPSPRETRWSSPCATTPRYTRKRTPASP
jgi:hypothetical protein